MSQTTLSKLESIDEKIKKLEHEKKELKTRLKQSILDIVDEKIILSDHFETLVGGILFVQNTLSVTGEGSHEHITLWKTEGALYLKNGKQNIKSKKQLKQKKQSEQRT